MITLHCVKHNGDGTRASLRFFIYPNIESDLTSFGAEDGRGFKVADVASRNYDSIWVQGTGAGRALELS